jgi:PadR family transcriptional regulator PadR
LARPDSCAILRRMAPDPDRRTQLLRGALDTCLLALLARTPTHAYDLVVLLEQHGLPGVGYGTVYPLMGRLRRQGLVTERAEPSPSGPPRKVYEVSPAGRAALAEWTQQWVDTTSAITGLLASAGALQPDEESPRVHS